VSEPYHSGSITVQERTGERDLADANGRIIGAKISERAQPFLAKQSYCALGWVDRDGMLWGSFVEAGPGFASSAADGEKLELDLSRVKNAPHSIPALGSLPAARRVGLLFIDLETRRRLRVNGNVETLSSTSLTIDVSESFPNCPKYIQSRVMKPRASARRAPASESGDSMTREVAALIAAADTAFVSSMSPAGDIECSHRGGRPGFVQIRDSALHIPDYRGNSMFKSLGNLLLTPRAGLCFVDFDGGRQLQITGDVRVDLGTNRADEASCDVRPSWSLIPRQWKLAPLMSEVDWQFIAPSPFNP